MSESENEVLFRRFLLRLVDELAGAGICQTRTQQRIHDLEAALTKERADRAELIAMMDCQAARIKALEGKV
jgi:hypothetical protein